MHLYNDKKNPPTSTYRHLPHHLCLGNLPSQHRAQRPHIRRVHHAKVIWQRESVSHIISAGQEGRLDAGETQTYLHPPYAPSLHRPTSHSNHSDQKTSSGRTAFDFVPPDSDMSFYLHDNGYNIGNAGLGDDFYNPGFSQDRFEEEMAENEMRRRLMMESARDLEVDLGNVGMDDQPEVRAQNDKPPHSY